MKIAIDGLSIDSNELREYTYGFFQSIATCLEEDFSVFLPSIFNIMIHSSLCEDSEVEKKDTTSFVNEDMESDDDDDDFSNDGLVGVRSAVIDEKSAAISALGVFCEVCKENYSPYWKNTFESFILNTSHYHEDVKRFAVSGLKSLFSIFPNIVSKEIKESLDEVMYVFVTMLSDEEDKDTVARICEAISSFLRQFGKVMMSESQLAQLVDGLVDLLNKEAQCNEHDIKDEEADHDAILMIAVSDCVDDLARTYGSSFETLFKPLFIPLLSYAKDGRPDSDKIMAIGTLSEVSNAMGASIAPYHETLIQLFTSGAKSSNQDIKRNSIFGLGVLCMALPQQTQKLVMQVLQILLPIFKDTSKYSNYVVDNAAGTLSRIIIAHGSNIPMDQVLLGLVQVLPLREDFGENDIVYGCLLELLKNSHPSAAKLMPQIISLFSRVLGSENVKKEIQISIVNMIKELRGKYQQQMENIFKELNDNERNNLIKFL
jgi:importin-4